MDDKSAALTVGHRPAAGAPPVARVRVVSAVARSARVETATLVGLAVLAIAFTALDQFWPVHLDNPGARAAIETTVSICALVTAVLLGAQFKRSRRWSDLLLLSALATVSLTDFLFSALPALTGVDIPATGIRLATQVLVAIAFVVAAFGSNHATLATRRAVTMVGLLFLAGIALVGAIDLLTGAESSRQAVTWSSAVSAPYDSLSLWIAIGSSLALLVAGVAFARRIGDSGERASLLAGAAFMLAAASLQYLAVPVVAADWVTRRDGARLAAYGLLLLVALRQSVREQHARQAVALNAERERIVRDLHDGLAQDLVVIATHGQRLKAELGAEHPLTIAARRALAISRGAIVDLSASHAPSTEAALREVARELEARFEVKIEVLADVEGTLLERLDAREREHLVRIAREAIVNAVRHGGASQVDVLVEAQRSRLRLRISDNGCGITVPAPRTAVGFGLPTMRARCEALGGRLVARRRPTGGTELEVFVPRQEVG
jgi:signal transduction histidine kinase